MRAVVAAVGAGSLSCLLASWAESKRVLCIPKEPVQIKSEVSEVPATSRFFKEPLYFVLTFFGHVFAAAALCFSLYPGLYYVCGFLAQLAHTSVLFRPLSTGIMIFGQLGVYAAMFPMFPGVPGMLIIVYSILRPAWLYARTGQTDSARSAGFREAAAAGSRPPLAAGLFKGAILVVEGLAMLVAAYTGISVSGFQPVPMVLVASAMTAVSVAVVALDRALLSLLDGPLGVSVRP